MKLTITQPDDWHIHLRDGQFLTTTVKHAAMQFGKAIIMPNLTPPVCTVEAAREYQKTIQHVLPQNSPFWPLMTLYLTDRTTDQDIIKAKNSQVVFGCKLYPAGSTTHSESGIRKWEKLIPIFEKMEEVDFPLLIHGEVTDPGIDVFDREAKFLERDLGKMIERFSTLRIVLEHITTHEAVQFVSAASSRVGATITPHHLLLNRNDIFVGGIQPHHYCLPILKREKHQEALIQAATSGQPKFFLGTDSAPHPQENKESACGCAGIYSAHAAIELYCEVFEQAGALDKLEQFASFNGADFYQLPRNIKKISLIKENWEVPAYFRYGSSRLIPFRAGQTIHWKLMNE
jgi:dihydroorotase